MSAPERRSMPRATVISPALPSVIAASLMSCPPVCSANNASWTTRSISARPIRDCMTYFDSARINCDT
jgi:hypothetical protein